MNKLFAALAISMLTACAPGDQKAVELLDTAGFEEKQNNFEHAAKLYDEILKKYPASDVAKQAENRLTALKKRTP